MGSESTSRWAINIWKNHERILSTDDSDALVLMHQTINTHNADQICTEFEEFRKKKPYYIHSKQH